MRHAVLIAAALTCLAGAAQAQWGDPRPHLVVRSGGEVTVFRNTDIRPDCSSMGNQTITLTEPPQGGRAFVGRMPDYVSFPLNNPRSACNHRKVMATEILYRARPGFVGWDRFSAEVIDAGGVARMKHFTVEVR